MPPTRLGRYRVLGVIGTGAFATVLRAHDDRLDADVAVKLLAENHSLAPDIRERFVSEGQLLRRVRSPHVVAVHDLGETTTGQPFLVLDLASGGDLSARRTALGRGVVVTPQDVERVADGVAGALSALHAEQVVHRDVTPGNLLLTGAVRPRGPGDGLLQAGEDVVLADLGLSKDLAAASGLTVGTGTAGFAPPEQGAGGWVDPRADIWSASALLVWLVLGRPPDGRGQWVAALRDAGWRPLAEVLRRGLAEDPQRRHATAVAWRDEVRRALAPPPPPSPGQRRRRPGRRVLVPLVAAGALALLVGGWAVGDAGLLDPGRQSTEQLSDGRTRVVAEEDGLQVAVTGPESTTVGESATFVVEADGASSWTWVTPDGQTFVDEPSVTVDATSAGVAEVTLVGVDDAGRRVVVDHPLRVDAP